VTFLFIWTVRNFLLIVLLTFGCWSAWAQPDTMVARIIVLAYVLINLMFLVLALL